MIDKNWIRIPLHCPNCGFQAEAYIVDTRPYNPLLSQLPAVTELRCGRYNGKKKTVGCGWTGVLPDQKQPRKEPE